jgi:glycosyltransferase involved in cell wall biosynthesis
VKNIDIVLPVYNEEEGLAAFHAALDAQLKLLDQRYRFQIIYVLDRCRDNSLAVLREIAMANSNVKVIHLSRRFGHQMSLVAGIDHCRGDAVIMMDCDLQHPPEVLPRLLDGFDKGYEIVHAIRQYDSGTGFSKRWTSSLFYKIQNWLSPVTIEDGAADFRLISRKVASVFQNSIREQNQFLRGLFHWVGFNSTRILFVSPPRTAGRTKYRLLPLLAFSVAGITSFSKVPLRIATLLGFTISSLSVVYGIYLILLYFFAGHFPPGYTSLIVVILFIGGLQLTVLGILGEYLGSIFDEVKQRPLYVVDEVIEGAGV